MLQANNIQPQKYYGRAFIGNHIHHTLEIQRQTTHAISHCQVEVISLRCSDLLHDALSIADRYNKLMTLYADCRAFSRSNAVNEDILEGLQKK